MNENLEYYRDENEKIKNLLKVEKTKQASNNNIDENNNSETKSMKKELLEFQKRLEKLEQVGRTQSGAQAAGQQEELHQQQQQQQQQQQNHQQQHHQQQQQQHQQQQQQHQQQRNKNSKTTLIITDSMIGNIKNNDLTANTEDINEKVLIRKNPGHTAVELAKYLKIQIEFNDPDKVVVIAGTNDLSYSLQDKTFVAEQIAEKILEVGRVGKRHNIPVVTISSLFVRKNYEKNRYTQEVNEILKTKCADEGFKYIDQGNIKRNDISSDNLHLDDSGISKLRTNLLNHLNNKERSRSNNVESDEVPTEVDESDDEGRYRRIVPGTRTYSETLRDGEKAMIFSSSITKGIDTKRFNDCYVRGTADFQRFPGKQAHDLKTHIREQVEEKRPSTVIIQGTGNDLPTSTPVSKIADDLLEAATTCKRFGVERICIGGVTTRPGLQGRCIKLNAILERRCRTRNFIFIKNNHIFLGHLYDDVHLNNFGSKILANNYLDVLNPAVISR